MSKEISGTIPHQSTTVGTFARQEPRPGPAPSERAVAAPTRENASVREAIDPVDAGQRLDEVAEKAARSMFPDRDVRVESFHDEQTGRFVYRVADKDSGQVIHQSPPDQLLRFFASNRQPDEGPLVHLEA